VELEHLKTKTRLKDEKFASMRGESRLSVCLFAPGIKKGVSQE
jgi:hypothetical protein